MLTHKKGTLKEKITRHFWKIKDKRPEIRSKLIQIRTIPGTFVRIRPKVAYDKFFEGVFLLCQNFDTKKAP